MIGAAQNLRVEQSGFDVERVRADFPALHQMVHGKPLVYLDSAATSQKPQSVIDAAVKFYSSDNANVHRGVHALSERATQAYEAARVKIQRFIRAAKSREIVFVKGTTDAINLVAHSFVRPRLQAGDEILITAMEHHSNIVPWQLLCEEKGAKLRVAPINEQGELLLPELEALLGPRTRLLALAHVSNALGTINPVRRIVEMAHRRSVPVLLDGAQAVPHLPVDMQALDCDFYAFSGHKAFGPTGIGVLYGKEKWLEEMPPYQGGGDMILSVTFEKTVFNALPYKFEAGTPNVEGAIGLGVAIDYLNGLSVEQRLGFERELLAHGTRVLNQIPGLRLIGTAGDKAGVLSFVLADIHPHDIGTILDGEGIAVRTGHHCAQPLMRRFGIDATVRASLAFYNTPQELDRLGVALQKVKEIFK
jgi:cysteine desulfurase / selenocysteine lyase